MINSVVEWNYAHPDQSIIISIELEIGTKDELQFVLDADYVFLSKDFSQVMGWTSKETAVHNLRKYVKKKYAHFVMFLILRLSFL